MGLSCELIEIDDIYSLNRAATCCWGFQLVHQAMFLIQVVWVHQGLGIYVTFGCGIRAMLTGFFGYLILDGQYQTTSANAYGSSVWS